MAMGWKSIRGGRLYVDRFTRKVTSGREKTNPTCVSKCHQMAESVYKTTFLSDCNSVPIQRKSLHIWQEFRLFWGSFSPSESS